MRKPRDFFTTGEFAIICKVEKHVLFHYDKIGLFVPEIKADNGYRYYSYHQYDTFSIIKTLKNLGMSLQDIKIYIDQRNPELLLALLNNKTREIKQELIDLHGTLQMIDELQKTTQAGLYHQQDQIELIYLPQEIMLCTKNIEDNKGKEFASFMKEYIQFCNDLNITAPKLVNKIIRIDHIKNKDFINFSYLYVQTDQEIENRTLIRKAGHYLCGWHIGAYEDLYKSWDSIFQYAKKQQIKLGTFAYEEDMITDLAQKDERNYVIKLIVETIEHD